VLHVLLELERDGTRAVTNVTAARDARRCAETTRIRAPRGWRGGCS